MSKKEWYLVFPAIWVIVGYACLLSHKPIWDHHYPLVSIPACWMASCGIAELLNRKNWPAVFLSRRPREVFNVVMMVAIILSAFLLIRNAPKKVKHIRKLVTVEKKRDREAIERMKAYSDKVDFAFVDMSIYAFYAQIPVPPELGVITWKRRKVGKLGSAMVRSVVRQYKPGLILLSRYRKNEMRLDKYLERNYELIYQNSSPWIRLYAMKGLN